MRVKSLARVSRIHEAEDECSISRKVLMSVDLDNGLSVDIYIPEHELAKLLISGASVTCETRIHNKETLSL